MSSNPNIFRQNGLLSSTRNHYNYSSQQLQLRIVLTKTKKSQGKMYLTIATTHDVEQSASKN